MPELVENYRDDEGKYDEGHFNQRTPRSFCWFHADNIYHVVSFTCQSPPQCFSYCSMMKWSVMPAM